MVSVLFWRSRAEKLPPAALILFAYALCFSRQCAASCSVAMVIVNSMVRWEFLQVMFARPKLERIVSSWRKRGKPEHTGMSFALNSW